MMFKWTMDVTHDGPRLRDCFREKMVDDCQWCLCSVIWRFMHLTRCSESLSVHVDAYDPTLHMMGVGCATGPKTYDRSRRLH
jgi:hypothetical protein